MSVSLRKGVEQENMHQKRARQRAKTQGRCLEIQVTTPVTDVQICTAEHSLHVTIALCGCGLMFFLLVVCARLETKHARSWGEVWTPNFPAKNAQNAPWGPGAPIFNLPVSRWRGLGILTGELRTNIAHFARHLSCRSARKVAVSHVDPQMGVVVKNRVTPNWVARVNGDNDYNLRSISRWLDFDPYPNRSSMQ